MRISPIKNNYQNQPAFKELRIDRRMTTKLESKTPEYIKNLSILGRKLEGVVKFHVYLIDSFTPRIYADDKKAYGEKDYFKELKNDIEPNLGKPYYATYGEDTSAGIRPDIPKIFSDIYNKDSAAEKYEEFKKLDELHQAAEYSKLLDERAEIQEHKKFEEEMARKKAEEEKRQRQEEMKKAVSDLLDNFGVRNSSDRFSAPEEPKKKSWKFW